MAPSTSGDFTERSGKAMWSLRTMGSAQSSASVASSAATYRLTTVAIPTEPKTTIAMHALLIGAL